MTEETGPLTHTFSAITESLGTNVSQKAINCSPIPWNHHGSLAILANRYFGIFRFSLISFRIIGTDGTRYILSFL